MKIFTCPDLLVSCKVDQSPEAAKILLGNYINLDFDNFQQNIYWEGVGILKTHPCHHSWLQFYFNLQSRCDCHII